MYLAYFLAQHLKEALSDGLDQRDVLEEDLKEFSKLLVVLLAVVRLDVNLAPLWVGNPLQDNAEDLENALADTGRELFQLVVTLDPISEEVDHGPTDFQAVCVQDVNRFLDEELLELV